MYNDWHLIGSIAAIYYDSVAEFVLALVFSGVRLGAAELAEVRRAFEEHEHVYSTRYWL